MNDLTERQKLILTLAIHKYVQTAKPVASKDLVEDYHLTMSSATVRNELAALVDKGYLRQPHTSAGRVPTETAYRYFVERLLRQTQLPDEAIRTISHQFYQMRSDVEQWMRLAASVLASASHSASMVTAPHAEFTRLKHVELIATRGRQVLMVLVTLGGELHQRFLTLSEPVTQAQLTESATRATQLFNSMDVAAILALRSQMQGLDADLTGWILDEMNAINALGAGEIYLDGLTNIMNEPEFANSDEGRKALRVLEERPLLQDLLTRTMMTSNIGGVQVFIGGEGRLDELRQCSVVLSRYGSPGLATGTLGVLGPMRMPYGRAISTIRFLSTLLSDLVSDTLVE
jgi:heat-inducible transcriptional repressor